MGRAPIICKHGIRGIANCKDCQREQHTERVRELRRQKRELKEQEHALEKEYMQENTFIDVHSAGKGSVAVEASKAPQKASCGACRLRDILDCNVYRRFSVAKSGKCDQFKPWKEVKNHE